MGKENKNMDRNLKYNRNEKRVNDTYAKNNTDDDVTQYGEFISSFHHWVPLDKQKDIAGELNKMTKKKGDM